MRHLLAALLGAVVLAALVSVTPARAQSAKPKTHTALQKRTEARHARIVRREKARRWRSLFRRRHAAVRLAEKEIGTPYVWGGASPRGFDCSGLIVWVMRKLGIRLPHHAASQLGYGRRVSRDDLLPGDLVYFNGAEHMGIYIGHGRFIHAPHTGSYVHVSTLASRQLYTARRVIRAK